MVNTFQGLFWLENLVSERKKSLIRLKCARDFLNPMRDFANIYYFSIFWCIFFLPLGHGIFCQNFSKSLGILPQNNPWLLRQFPLCWVILFCSTLWKTALTIWTRDRSPTTFFPHSFRVIREQWCCKTWWLSPAPWLTNWWSLVMQRPDA